MHQPNSHCQEGVQVVETLTAKETNSNSGIVFIAEMSQWNVPIQWYLSNATQPRSGLSWLYSVHRTQPWLHETESPQGKIRWPVIQPMHKVPIESTLKATISGYAKFANFRADNSSLKVGTYYAILTHYPAILMNFLITAVLLTRSASLTISVTTQYWTCSS